MDSKRFMHLRDYVGYNNERLARMFGVEVAVIEAYCLGTQAVPETMAHQLEQFADWASEVGDTASKKDQAKIYLNNPE